MGYGSKLTSQLVERAQQLDTACPTLDRTEAERFSAIVGNARVIGLGEATHGTSEFTKLRHRLTRYLIEHHDVTMVGIEADWSSCLATNNVVLHGAGDPVEALMGQSYWMWRTTEMLEFIRWLREHNRHVPPLRRVQIFGLDAVQPAGAIRSVRRFLLKSNAPKTLLTEQVTNLFQSMQVWDHTHDDRITRAIRNLRTWIGKRAAHHTQDPEWWQAMQGVILLEQINARRRAATPADHYSVRDRAMAENAQRYLEHLGDARRAVLWAHNGHVTRDSRGLFDNSILTMGNALTSQYGDGYRPIGLMFGAGSLRAVVNVQAASPRPEIVSIGPPPPGSLDDTLSKLDLGPVAMLDLRACDRPLRDWLEAPHVTRMVGAQFTSEADTEARIVAGAGYDALLFVDQSTPTRPLPASAIKH